MISLAEARAHVLDRCPAPVVSEVPLADARGLVTLEGAIDGQIIVLRRGARNYFMLRLV